MKFHELSEYFEKLEETSSRNSMTEQLAELFKAVDVFEIETVCMLALGRLKPLYERVEFNLADKMVMRAIARAFDVEAIEVEKRYKEVGDLGEVAEQFKVRENGGDLEVNEVYEQLYEIAVDEGEGSQERKVAGLAELLNQVSALSNRYVVRMVLSKLRLGFSDKTILDALSVMATGSKKGKKRLERAYQKYPNIGRIARLTKEYGIDQVEEKTEMEVGVPVMPALAQRLKSAGEMVEKMGTVLAEPKYDGTRVQIHIHKQQATSNKQQEWQVKTFTRNLDENTHMFPELKTQEAMEQITAEEVILDSEAVGYDPKSGELVPFQKTITRKRKHGVESAAEEVPLKFFVFDILYKDGESMLEVPLDERRELLRSVIQEGPVYDMSEALIADSPQELREYHRLQLSKNLEGAMVKKLKSAYVSGRTGWRWVKFKEVEEAEGKLADTVDAVVMGFYRGKGKRAAFGIGAFLIGVRNGEGEYVTISKVGTGLTDGQWREMRKRLEQEVSMEQPKEYVVDKQLAPDVWVDPKVVVEIAADEITDSPMHSASVALRFPRLIRFRDDKDVEQATTLAEVAQIRKASS